MNKQYKHIDVEAGLFEKMQGHKEKLEEQLKVSCTWGEYFEAMLPKEATV